MARPTVLVMLALIALLPFVVRAVFVSGFYSDDPFIIHVYARNIARHGVFAFNLDRPTLAVTCPLWVVLLSLVARLPVDLPQAATFLGCAFASSAVLLMFPLVKRLTGHPALGLCGSFLLATDCWLLEWAGTGMETSLAVLLVAAYFLVFWGVRPGPYRSAMLGALAALAWMTRPECGLLVLLALGEPLVKGPARLKRFLAALAASLAMAVPWLVFAWRTFGTVVPNSLGVKMAGLARPAGTIRAALRVGGILAPAYGLFLIVIAAFVIRSIRTRRYAPLVKVLPGLAFAGLLTVFYVVNIFPIASRYFVPLGPIWIACALLFLQIMLGPAEAGSRAPALKGILSFCVLSFAVNAALFLAVVVPNAAMITTGMQAAYGDIGRWIDRHAPKGARVALYDVGIIGYYGERKIIDLHGLVTPEVKSDDRIALIRRERPEFVVMKSYVKNPMSEAAARLVSDWTAVMTRVLPGQGIMEKDPVRIVLYRCRWPHDAPSGAGKPHFHRFLKEVEHG